MVYSSDDITAVESWTATGYDQDDIALDADVTACMTNGTPADECDEWKEGTINCRVEIDIGVPPAALITLKVRFYFTSVMTAGPNALLPYIDANSVSTTNEVIQDYTTPGQWIEHICSPEFIAQLADQGGGVIAVRLGANTGAAKSKLGEVEVDYTIETFPLAGITKDKNGDVLGSMEVTLERVTSHGPPHTYEIVETAISNAVTGAFSFQVPRDVEHRVIFHKDGVTHVFDVTDNVLVGDTS